MTTQYTQNQIAQALMMNSQSEVIANVDRERNPSHRQVLQFFNIANVTRHAVLNMVYLPKEGELQVYKLIPVRVHNSTSNTAAYRNRVQYLQVSMDDKGVIADPETNQMIVRNSNPAVLNMFLTESIEEGGKTFNNPWNTLLASGFFRLVPVPALFNDEGLVQAFNSCSKDIINAHNYLKARTTGDLAFNADYQSHMATLYAAYQTQMTKLIQSGHLRLAYALSVADSSLVPAITMDSGTKNVNPFLRSSAILEKASYMPTINEFFGFARVNSEAISDEFNESLTTGIRPLSKEVEGGEETINNSKRTEATKLAIISDTFGNEASVLLRRQDQGYSNPNNQNQISLAKIFDDNTQNNEQLFVIGKYFPIVMSQDAGSSTNGLTRPTIVVNEYTKHRTNSNITSFEAALGSDFEVNSDSDDLSQMIANAQSIIDGASIDNGVAGSVTFSADESDNQSQLGSSKKDII
ncbi:hypothetical protein FDH01_gp139 [Acinetobacter phage vB_AbaM_ME3]|uniref:Uncharacterized protein n=1 Tax=Acinetobacter phage vB_AbaM_ME3 TaxID=1837876 RepID=A0A172Q111_9CAUD|nr:hypothetical protein FDH01_gp139 [Acinetobacter phage vB_AbaM_ME3]AND75483.1 hypothetical protein ME3_322 [Acinetobacter phage vB_AbaM_ME3]